MLLLWLLVGVVSCHEETVSRVDPKQYSVAQDRRFLLYEVNRGEGVNLRRDVYMRIANAVRTLRQRGENWVLVLPPWGGLYHWDDQETRVMWSALFDVASLNRFVPVIEFEEYLKKVPSHSISRVVYLQSFAEGWGANFEMKWEKRGCLQGDKYYTKEGDKWHGWFFSYGSVWARDLECVSFQGDSETLADMMQRDYAAESSVMLERAETVLHHSYGEKDYWMARRSMRYSPQLVSVAASFRRERLDSDDERDGVKREEDWRDDRPRSPPRGGPFVCAHWRRRDFVRAHGKQLPSVRGTAEQLTSLATRLGVRRVFLATDASSDEVNELRSLVPSVEVVRFGEGGEGDGLIDGQKTVVDQIICSHARHFIGTHQSTVSFRIHEDREMLAFPAETTFNRLCPDDATQEAGRPEGAGRCEPPSKWRIVY